MAIANSNDVLAKFDTTAYPKIDLDKEINRAESSIIRLLNEQWYPKFLRQNPQYIPQTLNFNLLVADEWVDAVVDYALAYYILPKITKLYGVNTSQQQAEYHNLWEEAIRDRLEFGINYDTQGTTLQFVETMPETDYLRVRK